MSQENPSSFWKDKRLSLVIYAGLGLRSIAMAIPGTEDIDTNRLWAAIAVDPASPLVYARSDWHDLTKAILMSKHLPNHSPPVSHQTSLGRIEDDPNHPPIGIYLFSLSTWAAKLLQGRVLWEGGLLNSKINFWPVLYALSTLVAASVLSRIQGGKNLWIVSLASWLNPGMLLHAPIFGHVGSVLTLLGFWSSILFFNTGFTGSVFFLALSCLTKPQGVLLLPVLIVATFVEGDWRLWRGLLLRLVLFCLRPFVPFILAGRVLTALNGWVELADVPVLSAQQSNASWIVSWLLPAISQNSLVGLRSEVIVRGIVEFQDLLILPPRPTALIFLGAFMSFSLVLLLQELRKGARLTIFWAAALNTYGITMRCLYPHENHLYEFFVYSLPLLFMQRWVFLRLFALLLIILVLNLYSFDGLGRGITTAALALRFSPAFDLRVALSWLNLAVLAWIIRAPRSYFDLTRPKNSTHNQQSAWVEKSHAMPASARRAS